MHSRQWMTMNVALLAAAIFMGWKLYGEWRGANQRYEALAEAEVTAQTALTPEWAQRATPPLEQLAAGNVFSADRGQAQPDDATSTAMPPEPVVIGTMNLGKNYEALMTSGGSASGQGMKRVKAGEEFGGYTVAEIQDHQVVLEFAGQRKTVSVYQSSRTVRRAQTPAQAATPVVESSTGQQPAAGQATAAPPRPATATPATAAPVPGDYAGDPNTKAYVEGNRIRIETETPFGKMVRYEDIPK